MRDRQQEWQDDKYTFITARADNLERYASLHEELINKNANFSDLTEEQHETILDALVLAGLYKRLLDLNNSHQNILSSLIEKIERAGESFKYRSKGFDLQKSMKWACQQMGWIESGKGKRDLLTDFEKKMLKDLYLFLIRYENTTKSNTEAIETIYQLFGFTTPNRCSIYLRKLGVKDIPEISDPQ
jgi:hypothetical protein